MEIKINLELDTIDVIKAKLKPAINDYFSATPEIHVGHQIFRARKAESKFYRIEDIKHPLPEYVTCNQRVNREGQPVFYASLQQDSPFFEADPDIGTHLIISTWEIMKTPTLNKIGYDKDILNRIGRSGELKYWQDPIGSPEDAEKNRGIRAILAEAFLRPVSEIEDIYKLSIAIAELFMDGEIFDGLIYPSVATRGNFDNLALKTEYANKHLKFIKAEYVLIKNKSTITGGNQYDCKKIDIADGFDKHGYINWAKDNCVLQDPSGKRIMIIGRDKDGIVKRVYEGPYREEK